jgi:hypothetical protein
MPGYLPMNQIIVEMSSFGSNKWMYVTKADDDFFENFVDEFGEKRLKTVKQMALSRSHFGYKVPLLMDEPIIEGGLKALERNLESMTTSRSGVEMKIKAYFDKNKEELDEIKRQQDKINGKLDQLLNQKLVKSS